MDRLEAKVRAKGLTVFARIDHAAGAAAVGLPLQPTEVLIFGNARGGAPFIDANQSVGIERRDVVFWLMAASSASAQPSDVSAMSDRMPHKRRPWIISRSRGEILVEPDVQI